MSADAPRAAGREGAPRTLIRWLWRSNIQAFAPSGRSGPMMIRARSHAPRRRLGALRRLLAAATVLGLLGLLIPAASPAAITILGSPLSVPATLNTAENLNYAGTDTRVPPSPEAPAGVIHTNHYGADTALWNTALGSGTTAVPTGGQALKISLEGCASPGHGGPPPLTQIHFQSLSPVPGGGAKVMLSSQPYDMPVCGEGGASGSTVSTYEPVNLCVSRGGFVALNDEGGFVEHFDRSGVRYQVLGAVRGSSLDSFIRGNGTGDGALFSPLDTSTMDGFAVTANTELMMQVTLGTGADARYVCPGGTRDAPPTYAPISVHPQTDGINHARIVSVAIYCRLISGCSGTATMTLAGRHGSVGHMGFNLLGNKTSHLPIRLAPQVMSLIRARHGVATTLTAVVGGTRVSQTVSVKIL
jgi:hypothetical protein